MTDSGLVGDGETTVQRRRATTVERDRRATLRVGIAGAGFMGAVHARCARLAGAQIAAVAASTPERSADAAAALGAERAATGAEELVLADDIDVVHVCTPNHLHAE